MKEDIGTIEFASLLYDFYGALLKENQAEIMRLYHEDNLSLSEIAEELGQSRQAIHYTLRKAEKILAEYEDKLGLVKKYKENERYVYEAKDIAGRLLQDDNLNEAARSQIKYLQDIIMKVSE